MKTKRKGRASPDFGVALPNLESWRRAVDAELERRDMDRADLAKRIGCEPSAVSHILTGRYKSSSLIRPISEMLEISVPMPTITDDEMAEWLSLGEELRRKMHPMFVSLLAAARAALSR